MISMIRREGVMACYEHMRKKLEDNNNNDDVFYNRLHSYFQALETNKIIEYHRKRGRW